MSLSRDFKGVWIPREIWLAKDLNCQEKCLWAEIHSLYNREKRGCYASNQYLMDFLGVKERRLQEMMANLKEKGWVENVSFDGRTRIIKAIIPPEDFEYQDVKDCAEQGCGKVHPTDAEKRTSKMQNPAPLPIYRDISIEQSIDIPPLPPKKTEIEAKASEKSFSKDFDPEIKQLAQDILADLVREKPSYAVPRDLTQLYTHLDFMIRLDKRDPQKILDLLRWALSDDFWRPHMFKPNIAKYLRPKFDQLEEKMIIKPKQKERRFAPSSDQEKAAQALKDMRKNAL